MARRVGRQVAHDGEGKAKSQSTSLKPEQQQHNLVPNDCVPFTMYSLVVSDFTSMLVIVSILGFTVSSFCRASEMTYWLKLLVAKSDDLNSIS